MQMRSGKFAVRPGKLGVGATRHPPRFYKVYKVLESSKKLYNVLQSFTRSYMVLQRFTRLTKLYKVLQFFTKFLKLLRTP